MLAWIGTVSVIVWLACNCRSWRTYRSNRGGVQFEIWAVFCNFKPHSAIFGFENFFGSWGRLFSKIFKIICCIHCCLMLLRKHINRVYLVSRGNNGSPTISFFRSIQESVVILVQTRFLLMVYTSSVVFCCSRCHSGFILLHNGRYWLLICGLVYCHEILHLLLRLILILIGQLILLPVLLLVNLDVYLACICHQLVVFCLI